MKSTFLSELNEFISKNNLFRGAFQRVYISNKFLPASFRRAIIEKANRLNKLSELDDSFALVRDKSGEHLCMLVTFSGAKTNILLKDTDDRIFIDEKYSPYQIDEIILDASMKDVRSDLYFAAVDSLKTNYNYSDTDARSLAAQKTDEILQSFSEKDFVEGAKIEESLERIKPLIEEYILYISELYRTNVEENNSEVVVLPAIIPLLANIIFKQEKSHRLYTDVQSRLTSGLTPERVNEVIDYKKRQNLLKNLNPIVEGTCLNQVSDEIEYYVYLYRVSEDEYKFIFEPLSGKKCTKLINFTHEGYLDIKDIEKYAKMYLSMTEDEIIECDYAARFNHTSEETYNAVIPYAITMDADKYKCPYGTKTRIDGLNFDNPGIEKPKTL